MSLKLYYKEDDAFVEITEAGDYTSPLTTVHDGKVGDIQTVQVYVRNDDATKWYSNIIVKPIDLINSGIYDDVVYTETGWGVKLSAGSTEPTSGEWEDIDWGDQINIPNLGSDSVADIATYSPFWYLITCPPNTDAKIKTDIVLNISNTENSVVI